MCLVVVYASHARVLRLINELRDEDLACFKHHKTEKPYSELLATHAHNSQFIKLTSFTVFLKNPSVDSAACLLVW